LRIIKQYITVYLKDSATKETQKEIEEKLKTFPELSKIQFISKDDAKTHFENQMATYAPELTKDPEFSQAFPASFQVALSSQEFIQKLDDITKQISEFNGVEEVSYGQEWVKNYKTFIVGIKRSIWIIISILFLGSLFVIANSIQASISHRRDEIEIFELVGATKTKNAGIIGEEADMNLEDTHKDKRPSTVLYHITKHMLYKFYRDAGEEPKLHLFNQLKEVAREWLDNYLSRKMLSRE
jgi:ABC-type antimicrobial peptide transport system permease subunit